MIFAEYNPRQLTKDQYKNLKDSITRFGIVDPIIINKHPERDNVIIGGHQRCRVAKDLGHKEIPCVELDLNPDKEKELNVRLNKNTGEWDYDALANYFDVGELTEWGFEKKELVGGDKSDIIEPEIEITPELYESHNYLVLYFDNEFDWQSAVDIFGVKPKHAVDSRENYKRVGTGRVVNGSDALKMIL